MMTEKTAKKREAAVIDSMKPYFEKVGNGLEYLKKCQEENERKNNAYRQRVENAIEDEREFQLLDQAERLAKETKFQTKIDNIEEAIQNNSSSVELLLKEMSIKCDHCGAFMSPVQIICHKCGAVSNIFPYQVNDTERVWSITANNIMPLSDRISKYESKKAPYTEIQHEFDAMMKIRSIADIYTQYGTSDREKQYFREIFQEADSFIDTSLNKTIEIAVVGDVKSGKSSLINALLGDTMASVDATPETGVLVKYRTTKEKNYIRVSFYSSEQWDKIYKSVKESGNRVIDRIEDVISDKDSYIGKDEIFTEFDSKDELKKAIMQWTSSESRQYFFVNEVEIGYHDDIFPNDIVLVDTPGLHDSVEYRSEITRSYIQNAHWVLACVENNNLCDVRTTQFLSSISANLQHDMTKMYIIATKSDMLSKKAREQKQKYLFAELACLYDGKEGILQNHFISVCAVPHLLLLNYLNKGYLDEDSMEDLETAILRFKYNFNNIANDKEKIYDDFGITKLFDRLNNNVICRYRKEIISIIKKDYASANKNIKSIADSAFYFAGQQLQEIQQSADDYFESAIEIEDLENQIQKIADMDDDLENQILNLKKRIEKGGE